MVTIMNDTVNHVEIVCLSRDTLPTENIPNGSTAYAMDTKASYWFNAEAGAWVAATQDVFLVKIESANVPATQYEGLEFDFTGASVTATWSDDNTDDVTDDVDIIGPKYLAAGDNTITLKYNDGTMVAEEVLTVSATAQALDSIAVKTAPTKTDYEAGECFDPAGLVVTATFNNDLTEDIAYPDDRLGFDPDIDDELEVEDTTVGITLTIGEVTANASQSITVIHDER